MTLNHTPFPFEAAQCLCLMNKMALREKAALLLQYRDACYESVSDISFSREGFQFHVHINLQQAFFVWGQSLFCSLVVLGRETGSLILVAGRLIGWCIDANKRESSFYIKKCGFCVSEVWIWNNLSGLQVFPSLMANSLGIPLGTLTMGNLWGCHEMLWCINRKSRQYIYMCRPC